MNALIEKLRYYRFLVLCWVGYYRWDENEIRLWMFQNGMGVTRDNTNLDN